MSIRNEWKRYMKSGNHQQFVDAVLSKKPSTKEEIVVIKYAQSLKETL